ncbi:bifunctional diguanylate cyclase/phosphodiesterase [Tabrizicola aquatica]|uniref:bifunctional diguanylate cyclase/phosphodiesterase n=1 Tax=Tabrizicola aquatica TaxID=909926 RepID=UPI000CD22516|nr:bifunctional diguanylate cyclase/phosphodiesterase [Tabrizicola aquatica]
MNVARIADRLNRPEVLVFLPALVLAALWLGGEALVPLAVGLLAVLAARPRSLSASDLMPASDQVVAQLEAALTEGQKSGASTGCLVVQFDDASDLCDRHGRVRQSELLAACIARLRGALRPGDRLYALEDGSMAVVLGPTFRLDLEAMVAIAGRLQLVVQQPMALCLDMAQVTCSIGFCHARLLPNPDGRALLEAAQIAADEAGRHRPSAIRAYTSDLAGARLARDALRAGFAAAVEAGQIRAHFQPQVSTDSGEVTGVEALARWHHPERGILAPAQFLPAIEGTELMAQLGQTMIDQGLAALVTWDAGDLRVPTVAVNLSAQELRDPYLPDRLRWELDRHDLSPARLTIEVLESVIAGGNDDAIARNIARIADMGCGVDLDDFGTGNASITSIRRFALGRLKIDRSFVREVDIDRGQQRIVTAILAMAEQLGLDTLAEGVETPGEHAMLAQLGCAHVQGYVLARPLPMEDVAGWLRQYRERMSAALRIGIRAERPN